MAETRGLSAAMAETRGLSAAMAETRGLSAAMAETRGPECSNGRNQGPECSNGRNQGPECSNGRNLGPECSNGTTKGPCKRKKREGLVLYITQVTLGGRGGGAHIQVAYTKLVYHSGRAVSVPHVHFMSTCKPTKLSL